MSGRVINLSAERRRRARPAPADVESVGYRVDITDGRVCLELWHGESGVQYTMTARIAGAISRRLARAAERLKARRA